MNVVGRGEISRALVNARPKDSRTGTKKNRIRSSTAGLTMARPTNPCRPPAPRRRLRRWAWPTVAVAEGTPGGEVTDIVPPARGEATRPGRPQRPAPGPVGSAGLLVVAVLLDVGVDVRDRLVEDRLGVTAGEDVRGGLLVDGGDERVRARRWPDQGQLLGEVVEDPGLPARLEVGDLGRRRLRRR